MTELATVEGVELAAVGTHDCMTGTWDCTPQDITDAVAASQEPDWRAPVIKLGHTDPRFDGQPAVGTIRNLRASDDGTRLIGDLTDMPKWLVDVMHSAYPSRSVEGLRKDIAASGRAYSFRLTALALLGVEPPAIESLADVAKMYAVAAANSQQASGFGIPVVTAPQDAPVAASAAVTINPEGAGMPELTPEQLREAVGLGPDAPPLAVQSKLAALGLIPPVDEPKEDKATAVAQMDGTQVTESVKRVEETKVELPDISEHPVFKELKSSHDGLAAKVQSLEEKQVSEEKDKFLADAVAAGRMKPADKDKFALLYDADPKTTKDIVLARKRGSEVPVTAVGHADNPEGTIDEFELAFPDPDLKG